MRPEEYVAILWRRWWVLVLAMLAAAAVAFGYSRLQPPTYQVSVRILAQAQPPDYWLDLYAKNQLGVFQDMIRNGDFVRQALQRAGLSVDPGYALSTLALARDQNSNTVQLVVTDTDPQRAAAIANAVADAFVAQMQNQMQQVLAQFRDPQTGKPPGTLLVSKLDTATPPSIPTGPRVKLNTAAGGVLGLALGVLLAFALEYIDDTLYTEADVQRALGLDSIARLNGVRRGRREEYRMASSALVVVTQPRSAEAEAYRALALSLRFRGRQQPVRRLLLVSPGDSSATAVVAANVGLARALAGERVVLIDTDLRGGHLHHLFDLPPTPGLAEWLQCHDQREPAPHATSYERLAVLPAGQLGEGTSPADLLAAAPLDHLMTTLESQADALILTAAPLPTYGDALALAPLVDGALLLVEGGRTRRTAAQEAKAALERAGATVLGVVFTRR